MTSDPSATDMLKGVTILQVIPELDAGGAERTVIEVAEAITRAGGQALVASAGGRMEIELKEAGGILIPNPTLPSKNPFTIRRNARWLAGVMRQEKVSIIHARSRAPAWSAYWAAKSVGVPFVTTYHGTYNARSAFKKWYNSVMAKGDAVIANSAFIADHVRAQFPETTGRLTTISRGVDLDALDPERISDAEKQALSLKWFGNKAPGFVILLPGRLTSWKGQQDAIAAMGLLAAQHTLPAWTLVLAGDAQGRTAHLDNLKSQIAEQKLDEHIFIVGHCDNMPVAYALADLVLAPSRDPEAFGRVAAEAGAMKKPVIASDHGGQALIVVNGKTGWLSSPQAPEQLAKAIKIAMLDMTGAERQAMGEQARAYVAPRFSKSALQAATLEVYNGLLRNGISNA